MPDYAPAIPGPHNIVTGQLSNGLRVWVYENFESQTISLQGYAPGGSINETPQQAGLADFTASMLRRGSLDHDYDAINEMLEDVGASIGFDAGRHTLVFDAYSLAEDFDLALSLLAESLLRPAFAADELEKARQRLLTYLDERQHSTRSQAALLFRKHLYPPTHPYHTSLAGEIETVQRLTRADMLRFYREKVSPAGGVIVVVGAIHADEALARLQRALGDWRHPQARPDLSIPPRPTLSGKVEESIAIPGKRQSDIVLGWPGIAHDDPDYYAILVCNSILGQFGLGGRLGQRIREELGLAYHVSSTFSVNRGAGDWRIMAGVNPENVATAIENIFVQVERIISQPPSPAELDDVQHYLTGSLPLRLETNAGIGSNLLNMAWYNLGQDYLLRYADRIWAVGAEDALRVARKYLSADEYVLAVAGPSAETVGGE